MYTLFFYNLLIIILFTVNATAFLLLYRKVKKPIYLWLFIMFVTYICYDLLLYMADYIAGFAHYYEESITSRPIPRTLISILMYMSYGYIVIYYLKSKILTQDIMAFAVFVLAIFIIPLFPLSKFSFFMYFTTSQLMFYYYIVRLYKGLDREIFGKTQIRQTKKFLLIAFLINTMIIVEDFIVIFNYDIIEGLSISINQRNFADDILSVYIAAVAIVYAWRVFTQSGYFSDELRFIPDNEIREQAFQISFDEFSKQYYFTQREKEIVLHMLQGQTNQEIADLLYITLGTVKTHIHNIYKKTGATKRSQIIEMIREL